MDTKCEHPPLRGRGLGETTVRYGLPYKGSKNGIADWIVDNLPSADVFVDLFFGGGGSHAPGNVDWKI